MPTVEDFYRRPSAWSARGPYVLRARQQVERALVDALNATAINLDADLLDVGTGSGAYLSVLIGLGAVPSRCHGVDLVPERITMARERCPAGDLRVADASDLPYETGTFDVVSQFTCLCNLPDAARKRAADEIVRVLRPSGRVVWFDIANAPAGEVTTPIPEPATLFPSMRVLHDRRLLSRAAALTRNRPRLSRVLESLPGPRMNRLMFLGR